ncbi:MAG: hypothetical protein ACREP6_10535 [Candidatus Binataceae bacterium]
MRRLAIGLSLVLILGSAGILHAQAFQQDMQNPQEYTNEDSQPLKIASYILAPLGFALEWGVARPLHYAATKTALAPVLSPNLERKYPPSPLAELPPPDKFTAAEHENPKEPTEAHIKKLPKSPPAQTSTGSARQPALH